jgi:hypothetical protein
MVRQLLGVALLTVIVGVGACSSAPLDPTTQQGSTEAEMGSINLPLTSTVGDTIYRLNLATFTITGPALGGKPRVIKPPVTEPVHNELLPVGSYSIQLEKGWVLEKGDATGKFLAVPAQLVTPNPVAFDVTGLAPGDAFFGFVTKSGDVSLGNGSVNVRIGVADCAAYDQYMAALGGLTADCLGTVDPRNYEVTKDGVLRPTFDSCPLDKSRMTPIRQLLSLQFRSARLPFAKECMSGRFQVAQQKFASSGVTSCPAWRKLDVVNPVNSDNIDTIISMLAKLSPRDNGQGLPAALVDRLKINTSYTVTGDVAGQKCQTPADCAAVCSSAFPGFFVRGDGNFVLTDPTAWLLDNTYQTQTSDPFLRPGYYHPMSYYGPLPGALFAEWARYQPCGPLVSCSPEICSYYAGSHIKAFLQPDCLVDGDVDTCVSYCGPKLP